MKSICTIFILLLVFVTSAQCQLTAVDWYNKGNDLLAQSKYSEAVLAYDQAIQLKPNYDAAWYYKGVALKALNLTNESNAAFAEAKNLTNLFFASTESPAGSSAYIPAGSYPGYYPGNYYPYDYYYPYGYYSYDYLQPFAPSGWIYSGEHPDGHGPGGHGNDDHHHKKP